MIKAPPQEAAAVAENMKPLFFARYVKAAQEKGLPGKEALKFFQKYMKTVK